jgi:hypothetical protein
MIIETPHELFNSHLTLFGHFTSSQSHFIVGFKNTSILNVLQSSLIVIQYTFEQNHDFSRLFGIVGLNFLM